MVFGELARVSGLSAPGRLHEKLASANPDVETMPGEPADRRVDRLRPSRNVVEQATKFAHELTPDIVFEPQALKDRCDCFRSLTAFAFHESTSSPVEKLQIV